MMRKILIGVFVAAIALSFVSCTNRDKNLGSEKNPVKVSFMPSAAPDVMEANAKIIADKLSKASGLAVEAVLAPTYISIIDGLGSKKVDAAFINSLGYLLARDWSGAEAILQLKGTDGNLDYKSAIIINTESGIKKLSDLNGKKFAYTDPFSMAGYLMPLYLFFQNKINPIASFANSYDAAVEEVYNNAAPAGAIYYHKRDPYGRIRDAREKLIGKHNDLLDKVSILGFAGSIPNTPVVFRKDLPKEAGPRLKEAFLKIGEDPEVLAALEKMYDATGLAPADEKGFDEIRNILKTLGKDVKEVVPGGVTFYQQHIWEKVPD